MKRLVALLLLLCLGGCAAVVREPADLSRVSVPGIYHEVKRGESIWKISKIYGVELKDVVRANRLPDASKIEAGQLIFIPEAGEDTATRVRYAKGAKIDVFIWPVKGTVVSYFGSMKDMVKNKGIDIQVREGSSVAASRGGKVTFASGHMEGYGKTVIIDHLDGFETVYAHNAENLVTVDQRVKKGEVIAKAGKTGRPDKPGLHFEIRKNHKPQNPFYYLP
ncbi:MAG: peptidoglycan DD-metalloendopeptidase family protein [Candidatus Omnitrophota bacterium]